MFRSTLSRPIKIVAAKTGRGEKLNENTNNKIKGRLFAYMFIYDDALRRLTGFLFYDGDQTKRGTAGRYRPKSISSVYTPGVGHDDVKTIIFTNDCVRSVRETNTLIVGKNRLSFRTVFVLVINTFVPITESFNVR